jgi:broad-specificity NMP kinase
VGKTTLGKRLRAHFPQGITIEVDSFKSMVNLLDWNDTTQYHHILEAVAMTCRSYLDNGYAPVIIIDTLSAETLGDFMAILQKSPLEATCLIITLVCDPDVLELRIKGRENGFSLIEPSLAINDDMRKYRVFDEFLVDTTTSSPDDVLALVLARI